MYCDDLMVVMDSQETESRLNLFIKIVLLALCSLFILANFLNFLYSLFAGPNHFLFDPNDSATNPFQR